MNDTQVIDRPDLNQLTMYDGVRGELARLEKENENTVFDYTKDEKAVRSHIYQFRTLKGNIERERKALKADALAFGRRVDSAAKELTSRVEKMIAVHQEPLDRIAQQEAERVAAINKALDQISQPAESLPEDASAERIAAALNATESIEINPDVYQERMADAAKLQGAMVDVLKSRHERQVKHEAEQAELERLRKEQAERERQEREAQIAREAEERARREAEEKAEAERKAAAEREQQLKADADRRVREERERHERAEAARKAEIEKRAANRRHVDSVQAQAAKAITTIEGVNESQARAIVTLIVNGDVPHVAITY